MKSYNKILILIFACNCAQPTYTFHPIFKWSAAIIGSVLGYKGYKEYRFYQDKRDLFHAQRSVVLTIESLGNDCKTFQEYAARQRLEDILKQRFTTSDGAAPSNPTIGEYQARVKTLRSKHEEIDTKYRDNVEDWKEAERYKPMVPAAITLIADNEKLLKQIKVLEALVGQGVPFVQLLMLTVKATQTTQELRKTRDVQQTVLNRYRDPQFPYPFVKCVKELQEIQQELVKAERALQTNGKGSINLLYDSATLRAELEKILHSINDQFYQQQKEQLNREHHLREIQVLEQQAKIAKERLIEERRRNDLKQAEIAANTQIIVECREQLQIQKRNVQTLENELGLLRKTLEAAHQEDLAMQKKLNSLKEKLVSFTQTLSNPPVNAEALDKNMREWWQQLQNELTKLQEKLDGVGKQA